MVSNRSRIVITAIIAGLTIPLAADLLTSDNDLLTSVLQFREDALQDRVRQRRQEREYWRAIEEFQKRLKAGESDLVKPDVNDQDSIDFYLKPAAPEVEKLTKIIDDGTTASSLQMQDLTEYDRQVLRSYTRANSCPETMENYMPGFYELCVSLTAQSSRNTVRQGLINFSQFQRMHKAAPKATLKDRIRMTKEAIFDPRDDLLRPLRFQGSQ